MYRKSSLNALHDPSSSIRNASDPTGLLAFSPYLPEDNLIALSIMHQLKLSHQMTPDLAMDCLGPMTITEYAARRIRWIRVRMRMVLAATLIEPLTESILLGIVAGWASRTLFNFSPGWFFVAHEAAWTTMDIMVVSTLRGETLKGKDLWDWLFVWGVREVLALPVWLKAVLGGSTVVWRGTRYRIEKNGMLRSEWPPSSLLKSFPSSGKAVKLSQ
jgi:ceramide glucosyltransferase